MLTVNRALFSVVFRAIARRNCFVTVTFRPYFPEVSCASFSTENQSPEIKNKSFPSPTNANNKQKTSQKSKRNRLKRPLTMLYNNMRNAMKPEVNCVPLAETLDLEAIQRDEKLVQRFSISHIDGVNANKIALYCEPKKEGDGGLMVRGFFVFAEGVVVFWDIDRNTQSHVIQSLKAHQEEPIPDQLKNLEEETMGFDFVKGKSYANNDTIFLDSEQQQSGTSSTLTMFAFSHAMAASVKLGIWEETLEKLDDEVRSCIEGLKDSHHGRIRLPWASSIPWNHKKALMMIGNFAELRHIVNSTDLLSKDIYWDLPEPESSYGSLARRLTLNNRRNELNERLGYSEYFCKTISDALNTDLSHLLEWIIILLIAFECIHIALPWFSSTLNEKKKAEKDVPNDHSTTKR